jgi:hypothetical protein
MPPRGTAHQLAKRMVVPEARWIAPRQPAAA